MGASHRAGVHPTDEGVLRSSSSPIYDMPSHLFRRLPLHAQWHQVCEPRDDGANASGSLRMLRFARTCKANASDITLVLVRVTLSVRDHPASAPPDDLSQSRGNMRCELVSAARLVHVPCTFLEHCQHPRMVTTISTSCRKIQHLRRNVCLLLRWNPGSGTGVPIRFHPRRQSPRARHRGFG